MSIQRERREGLIAARKAAGHSQYSLASQVRVDRSTVVRWESGETEPQPWTWPALADALHVSTDHLHALLGQKNVTATGAGAHAEEVPQTAITVHGMVKAAAYDARRISISMEFIGSESVQMYRDALIGSSADFLHRPVAEVFGEVAALRKELFGDIESRRHHPRHSRELLTLLGMTSVVLAHASHLLGHPTEGMTQARLACLCADDADHVELGAWACGTQALLAEGTGRLREALVHVRAAQERLARSRTPGSAAVRLASYEARIAARLFGESEAVQAAMTAAERARDTLRDSQEVADLDDVGGILHFPEPKAQMYAGQVRSLTGHSTLAEDHARAAIDGYLSGQPEQLSYGDIALARIDIATARLTTGDLEGVREALDQVFALPAALRIEPLRPPLAALANALATSRYCDAVAASDIRDSVHTFAATPRLELERR